MTALANIVYNGITFQHVATGSNSVTYREVLSDTVTGLSARTFVASWSLDSKKAVFRTKVQFAYPVMASIAAGCCEQPSVAYTLRSVTEMIIPVNSTNAQRTSMNQCVKEFVVNNAPWTGLVINLIPMSL